MNPTAIYSKSGKGVQEAAGKTSNLKRPDRAVLAAIDGRTTLADVAQKVGKSFDAGFEQLIAQLDRDGYVREVSAGTAPAAAPKAAPRPSGKTPAKPAAAEEGADLDFSSLAPSPPPRPAAAPDPAATARAKEQESALTKARQQAEARAQAERDRARQEAEAKVRAEMEAKMRAEAEAKAKAAGDAKQRAEAEARLRAEAEEKIRVAREAAVRAAAEAKAKADAEARRVREEAEKAKREAEELKQRLEAERKAREEAERKAKEEAERARKQLEEERRQLEEERKRREEEERKAEEERIARRKREEEEEQARRKQREEERKRREEEERKAEEERAARRKQREEEERKAEEERAARRKQREEEEARHLKEQEERRKRAEEKERAEEQERAAAEKLQAAPPAPAASAPAPAAGGGGFSDSLLADLDSFGKQDEEEQKAKEEAERKAKQEAERRAREEAERRDKEEAERRRREEEGERRKAEEARQAREAEERRAREEEERERKEEEERKRKAQEAAAKQREVAAKPVAAGTDGDIPVTDEDLDLDDVKREQQALAKAAKQAPRPPEPETAEAVSYTPKRKVSWGKPVALGLALILVAALGVVHVMPIGTADYERAASEALSRPVKISSGRLWLLTGAQLRFQGVTVGGAKFANVVAFPTLGSLSGENKVFSRIELDGVTIPQEALGDVLFAKVKSDRFTVARIVARKVELAGPLPLPKELEADIMLDAEGALRSAAVRGPESLVAKLAPKGAAIDFEVNAGSFALPVAPEVALSQFAMKGAATRQEMTIAEWDGALLSGTISGTANVRWGGTWSVEGVITARGINAAVFAPALLSEGRAEGTGKFALRGAEPAKLGATGRIEGNFTVNKGVLGSFDLSRAIQTAGRQAQGRTQFSEMTGQAVYDRGAVALRNVTIGAGALNAGASADIAQGGELSGRIVADVRTPNQTLRATLQLGGTVKEPQVRN